jgi:hypothetical protein
VRFVDRVHKNFPARLPLRAFVSMDELDAPSRFQTWPPEVEFAHLRFASREHSRDMVNSNLHARRFEG